MVSSSSSMLFGSSKGEFMRGMQRSSDRKTDKMDGLSTNAKSGGAFYSDWSVLLFKMHTVGVQQGGETIPCRL